MTLVVETSYGPAHVELDAAPEPRSLVVLTHGAGGGVEAADLSIVRDEALAAGATVARVLQPYRVAGRRAPGAAGAQDAAWREVVAALRIDGVPLVLGGRSNGARVACRTATELGAKGVVALAFPLHPPGKPERTRVDELRAFGNVVVINGANDPFGIPDAADAKAVHVLAGQAHSFKRTADLEIARIVRPLLRRWRSRPA